MRQMDFRAELAKLTPRLRDNRPGKIYIFGAGWQWQGIHQWYINVVNTDLADYIYAFVDNDPAKQGTTHMGRPVISPPDLDLDNAVVLISSSLHNVEIRKQLNNLGLVYANGYFDPHCFNNILMRFVYAETASFTNSVKGGRCFIIGNGSSLSVEDLEKLQKNNEVSFGVNKIMKVFNKTSWRPSYYFIHDMYILNEISISDIYCPKFIGLHNAAKKLFDKNTYYFDIDLSPYYYDFPYRCKFSSNIERVYVGGSIIYTVIQAAVSIGFTEIYLLGTDQNFPIDVSHDGNIVTTRDTNAHFYNRNDSGVHIVTSLQTINVALKCAREYCESHNIKIFNATRGGVIELFERVNFDSLF